MKAMQTQFFLDNQAFLLKNTSIFTSSTLGQTPGQNGQTPNTGYTHGFTPKQSFPQSNYPKKPHQKRKGDDKDSLWCDFRQRHRHTRDTCWKIHGRPTLSQSHVMMQPTANTWQQPTQNTWQQYPVHQTNDSGGDKKDIALLKEKVEQLVAILANSSSIIGSTSVANSGKKFILDKIVSIRANKSLTPVEISNSWILDSGATDHMTPTYDLLSSYVPCTMDRKVQTADGTLLTVSRIVTITLKSMGSSPFTRPPWIQVVSHNYR